MIMDQQHFDQMYQAQAPWDTGRPQPAIVKLAEAGLIRGVVLDVGCGTGENALYLAARGHECWGMDFVPVAISRAKAKAAERRIHAHFLVGNALELSTVGKQFDTLIDCGLFHTFGDAERAAFVRELAGILRPGGWLYLLCFSNEQPGTEGPRRISQQEIREAFHDGWSVRQIEPTHFESIPRPGGPDFGPAGPKAWLAAIERTATAHRAGNRIPHTSPTRKRG
jgi:ubiquinone/menaquinone biosynthesis C-methylase UbiE